MAKKELSVPEILEEICYRFARYKNSGQTASFVRERMKFSGEVTFRLIDQALTLGLNSGRLRVSEDRFWLPQPPPKEGTPAPKKPVPTLDEERKVTFLMGQFERKGIGEFNRLLRLEPSVRVKRFASERLLERRQPRLFD